MPARCRDPPRREALDEPGFQEQIAVFDRWHNEVGMRTQWDVHTLGLWHESAAVLMFDKSRLLLQQRSTRKWTYPGAWDASVAETMEADELPAAAAARGVLEELNIALRVADTFEGWETRGDGAAMYFAASKPVCWAGRQPEMDLKDCEIVHIYVVRDFLSNADADSLALRSETDKGELGTKGRGEVESLRWIEMEALSKEIEASPGSFTPVLLSAWYECRDCWGPNVAEHAIPSKLLPR